MIFQINKGINRPIEFKGIKAQYLGYLAAGLVGLLISFATLYLCGANVYFCMLLTFLLGVLLFANINRMSKKYGRYGLLKRRAKSQIPDTLCFHTRKTFTQLSAHGKSN